MNRKQAEMALWRVLDKLPDEAVSVSEGGDTVEIFIDWRQVPDA